MATAGEIRVKIIAEDHVTPVLKSIQRRLFWYRYGPSIAAAIAVAGTLIVGFVLGLQVH